MPPYHRARALSGAIFERAFEEPGSLPVYLALVKQDHRFGVADDCVGVAATGTRVCLGEGAARERIVAEDRGGSTEQLPALHVLGPARQSLLQLSHDALQVGCCDRWRFDRRTPVPLAEREIDQEGDDGQCGGGDCRGDSGAGGRICGRSSAQQRPGDEADGCRDEYRADGDKRGHGISGPSSSEPGFERAANARRRTTTITTASPPARNKAGAAHSSQVRGATGGRRSTKSP